MIILDVLKYQDIDNLNSYKSISLPDVFFNIWHLFRFRTMYLNIYLGYEFQIIWYCQDAWDTSWQYFRVFAGKVFQQTPGIPMGTRCSPFVADIFLYSYEADFKQSLLSTGKKQLASLFNLTYRYIDDVLSINNTEFENCLGQIYLAELKIQDTTESTALKFCFLPRFPTLNWEGWSTSHFYLRQTRWFKFPHHKLSVPE